MFWFHIDIFRLFSLSPYFGEVEIGDGEGNIEFIRAVRLKRPKRWKLLEAACPTQKGELLEAACPTQKVENS